MNIRPKLILKFEKGKPATVNWTNPLSNWFTRSGNFGILEGTYELLKPLYDKWKSTGNPEDYRAYKEKVDELNNDLRMGYAPGHLQYSTNGQNLFIGLGNNSSWTGTSSWQNTINNKYRFINNSIGNNFNKYHIVSPKPTSRDRKGIWNADDYWAGITDDRTTWGNLYGIDENDPEYIKWKNKFKEIGITYRTKPEWGTNDVLYGFLDNQENGPVTIKPVETEKILTPTVTFPPLTEDSRLKIEKAKRNELDVRTQGNETGFDWSKFKENLANRLPGILGAGRLAFTLWNNNRIYNEALKGIRPNLLQSYNTYRLIVGDEATKQAYYRRAALGQTKAARPFTSDADKQMAYQFEAKRVGDELRAQGDLADNLEIRRTSDESMQHAWANTQRATEVANTNTAAINQANALKHNLIALKYSANGTSIDNYLKGIESKWNQRLAERKAILDLIASLDTLNRISSNEDLLKLQEEWLKLYNEGKYVEAQKKSKEYNNLKNELIRLELNNRIPSFTLFGEKGIKLTYKRKDDLLYKSTRDAVEHFRKMSKISSDAHNRRTPKIEKLASHPKGSRKYLLGGVAPFMVYTPVTMGGETSMTSSVGVEGSSTSSKSSSKSDKGKETLDLIKSLFSAISEKGLPSDVNVLYQSLNGVMARAKAFGEDISTDDLATMYLLQMNTLSQILYHKSRFDNAEAALKENLGENEIAVTADGLYVVQDPKTGVISTTKDLNFKEQGVNPVTNGELLNIRALTGKYAFNEKFIEAASNGIGIQKVGTYIKSILPSLKLTASKTDSYVSKQVAKGIAALELAPEGDYKRTITDKNSLALAEQALKFIYNSIPENMKAVIKLHASQEGLSVKQYIASLISAETSVEHDEEYTAVTGKAALKDSNGTDNVKSNFLDLIQRDLIGIDRPFEIITKDGNTRLYSLNSKYISLLPNVTENTSLDKMLGESKIGTIMDSRLGVTFGDLVIAPENFKDVMFDTGGGATIVTLPCRYENGHKIVNFAIKDEFDDAIKEVSKTIPVNYLDLRFTLALALKLHEKGLDSLLKGDSIDPNMFGHFVVVSAYTTDKVKFDTSSKYIEKVKNPSKDLENTIVRALSSNKDKNDYKIDIDDKWGLFELTYDDIYRGQIFIPINNDPISALTGWGNNIKLDEAQGLAELYQNYLKSSKIKETSSSVL